MGKIVLVIFLKNKLKLFLRTIIISISCCALFVGIGYFYLNSKMNEPARAELVREPYSFSLQSAGILFDIEGEKSFFYLDFNSNCIVAIASKFEIEKETVYGYSIDYKVNADYNFLSGLIDRLGGLELSSKEYLVYTGVQVVEILKENPQDYELKKDIIKEILDIISQRGFNDKDFLFITENSETNLTVPKFYYWQDKISELCENVIMDN